MFHATVKKKQSPEQIYGIPLFKAQQSYEGTDFMNFNLQNNLNVILFIESKSGLFEHPTFIFLQCTLIFINLNM